MNMNMRANEKPTLDTHKILLALRAAKIERRETWEQIQEDLDMPGGTFGRMLRNLKNGICPQGRTLLRIMLWLDMDLREFKK